MASPSRSFETVDAPSGAAAMRTRSEAEAMIRERGRMAIPPLARSPESSPAGRARNPAVSLLPDERDLDGRGLAGDDVDGGRRDLLELLLQALDPHLPGPHGRVVRRRLAARDLEPVPCARLGIGPSDEVDVQVVPVRRLAFA